MKKKVLALAVCAALLAVAIVGGTLAYFTDKDAADNVFTVGKIDIKLNEAGFDKTDDEYREELAKQTIVPAVIDGDTIKNALPKEVSITLEEGSKNAYVWYEYVVPAELNGVLHFHFKDTENWDGPVRVSKDAKSVVYVVKYKNMLTEEAPDTSVSMDQVYMDSTVDYNTATQKYEMLSGGAIEVIEMPAELKVNVRAYGIQADGFADYEAAYNAYQAK